MIRYLWTRDGVEVKPGDLVWRVDPDDPLEEEVCAAVEPWAMEFFRPTFSTRRAAILYRIEQVKAELSRLQAMLEPSESPDAV